MRLNERATEILGECAGILEAKGKDYAGGTLVSELDYYRFNLIPGADMLYTKLLRYVSVMEQGGANFEAADDSLKDMINYAARTIAYNEIRKEELGE